jgi:hypothetical protein
VKNQRQNRKAHIFWFVKATGISVRATEPGSPRIGALRNDIAFWVKITEFPVAFTGES